MFQLDRLQSLHSLSGAVLHEEVDGVVVVQLDVERDRESLLARQVITPSYTERSGLWRRILWEVRTEAGPLSSTGGMLEV